ncbi:hypothetical protein KAFR_0F03610 [Kazachstania africana CBS 2517]|uniref:Uncharacterized protein n=1 Tax=Kazachstania africana (strain ATCC 22294 / BCRC 22015 / CBS 2517 / CECT 1963 / NBRC 1671 / NRRL Y-8276) TaxID=1071382 RepID=H2AX57_KAZAF|nr:hypothetical protein KAFR_0F03610 [Kazachstania africana CBS 2517]CCF58957.1 hypothetical protein KAFR_0F03610 [Kazachstania africana CBS 2517]
MSAFNNYCVVCDKLIGASSNFSEEEKLYCSKACALNDETILLNGNTVVGKENVEYQESPTDSIDAPIITITTSIEENVSTTVLQQDDSIITSPLFVPINTNDSDSLFAKDYLISSMELPKPIYIPKLQGNSVCGQPQSSTDNTAENNYKLWLNNKMIQ